jgi:hypothetical protein
MEAQYSGSFLDFISLLVNAEETEAPVTALLVVLWRTVIALFSFRDSVH